MTNLLTHLWNDEAGFIISAELVLVATIAVLSMVVGLSELAHGVNQELEDVASAFGAVNQTYEYQGVAGHKGTSTGSFFEDHEDFCDSEFDIQCDNAPQAEGRDFSGNGYDY